MNIRKFLLGENVGGYDLVARAFFGSLAINLLALDVVESSPWKWILAVTAFAGLFSSILRHAPPYTLIGFSTAKK